MAGKINRRFLKGNVDEELNLGTLAAKALVGAVFDETVNERTRVSSIVATYTMQEFTPATGDGPILCGIAHSDYSDAEIEEVIENTGSWNEGDLVQQEVAKRMVRQIGVFGGPGEVSSALAMTLNDGDPISTKLNWILLQGQTLKVWAYNLGTSALATTVPILRVQGHCNLWPQ